MGRERNRLHSTILLCFPRTHPQTLICGEGWVGRKSKAWKAGLLPSHHGHLAHGCLPHVGCARPQKNVPWATPPPHQPQ